MRASLFFSFYSISCRTQRLLRLITLFGTDQDMIGIISGNRKDRDPGIGKHCAEVRKDAHQAELEHALDAEAAPVALDLYRVFRHILLAAEQRTFRVSMPGKAVWLVPVHLRQIVHFAYGKGFRKQFQMELTALHLSLAAA